MPWRIEKGDHRGGVPERRRADRPHCRGVWIEGYEAELDGFAPHKTRSTFNADRLRDRRLWKVGFRTMRLTDEALDDEQAVLDDLAHAGVNVPSRSRASSKPPRRSSTSPASVR